MSVVTVASMLAEARALGVDRLDGQLLLARALGRPRTWLVAHDDALLSASQAGEVRTGLQRRALGEPLAYVLGEKEFHGLMLQVDANVLVPRPDTEVLVDWALELLAGELSNVATPRVVDLGTGSGAVALAVKRGQSIADVLATDISANALRVARGNAQRLGLALRFAEGPWWLAAGDQRFELALSNPPYIAAADAHLAALRHEPLLALTPGGDGLDALRQIIGAARTHLTPSGWLLLEHGHDQAAAVGDLMRAQGFDVVASRRDLAGHVRCTGARA